MKSEVKTRIKESKHVLLFLLFVICEVAYFLTQFRNVDYNIIHIALDDYIPFLPVFVIPYFSPISASFSLSLGKLSLSINVPPKNPCWKGDHA